MSSHNLLNYGALFDVNASKYARLGEFIAYPSE